MKLAAAAIAVLLLCIPSAPAATVDHSTFDMILRENVRDDRIDYVQIKSHFMPDLKKYLDLLEFVDPAGLARNEQLAFYLNLYNATLICAISGRYHPGFSVADDNFRVFKEPLARLKSGAISLNDLRDKIIRPTFKDPRVHIGMVSGARSSPPMLPQAMHAGDVERILDENMKWFMSDRFRNPLFEGGNKPEIRLSPIFDWFSDDFGGKDAIVDYVWKYSGRNFHGYTISFTEYRWQLNEVPAR